MSTVEGSEGRQSARRVALGLRQVRRPAARLRVLAGRPMARRRLNRTPGLLSSRDLRTALRAEGMVAAVEVQELARLAAATQADQAIVEVGSWRGRSTVALALGSAQGHGAPVFAIDPHEPFTGLLGGDFGRGDRTEFFRNLLAAGVVERVRLLNSSSEIIAPGWKRPIGTLWLDGDHSYEGVLRDVRCWETHLVPGGVLAFHDARDPKLGPIRVIEELIDSRRYVRESTIKNMVVLRKLADPPA